MCACSCNCHVKSSEAVAKEGNYRCIIYPLSNWWGLKKYLAMDEQTSLVRRLGRGFQETTQWCSLQSMWVWLWPTPTCGRTIDQSIAIESTVQWSAASRTTTILAFYLCALDYNYYTFTFTCLWVVRPSWFLNPFFSVSVLQLLSDVFWSVPVRWCLLCLSWSISQQIWALYRVSYNGRSSKLIYQPVATYYEDFCTTFYLHYVGVLAYKAGLTALCCGDFKP